jgi:hypothetical protein
MRNYAFPLAAILVLAISFPSLAAEKPRPAQGAQNQPKKIWTNEDMGQLRARGLISIVGPAVNEAAPPATPAAAAPAEPAFPVYSSKLVDPEWYAEQAAKLQAELDEREAALQEQRTALAQAADRITQPGIALDKNNAGITPDSGLAILEAQVGEVQSELDELSDLARQNNIPPVVIRG